MNLNSAMRLTYLLAWVFTALALIHRALETMGIHALGVLPVTSRGMLFFGGLLFLATIATAEYIQSHGKT